MVQLKITVSVENERVESGEPVIIVHTSPTKFKSAVDFFTRAEECGLFEKHEVSEPKNRVRKGKVI